MPVEHPVATRAVGRLAANADAATGAVAITATRTTHAERHVATLRILEDSRPRAHALLSGTNCIDEGVEGAAR
jgi:hypothetical protein